MKALFYINTTDSKFLKIGFQFLNSKFEILNFVSVELKRTIWNIQILKILHCKC